MMDHPSVRRNLRERRRMRFPVRLAAMAATAAMTACLGCKEKRPEHAPQGVSAVPPGDGQSARAGSAAPGSAPEFVRNLSPAPPPKSIPAAPTSAPVAISDDLQMIAGYEYGRDSLVLAFESDEKYKPGKYKYLAFSGYGSSVWLDTVEVVIKPDSVSSFYSGDILGTVVSMATTPYHLACFRASSGLEAGAVKTWYLNKTWSDTRSKPPEWAGLEDSTLRKSLDLAELGTAEFSVAFDAGPDTTESGELNLARPFRWTMRIGSAPAIAFPIIGEPWVDPNYASADEAVLWIGDLDRDGKPDVLMAPVLGPGKGWYLYQLFLSRALVAGEEWKAAAEFYYYPPGMGD
jgi:hypothetical protein